MALPVKISSDCVVNIPNIQGLDIRNIHEKHERFISYCPGVLIQVKGFKRWVKDHVEITREFSVVSFERVSKVYKCQIYSLCHLRFKGFLSNKSHRLTDRHDKYKMLPNSIQGVIKHFKQRLRVIRTFELTSLRPCVKYMLSPMSTYLSVCVCGRE